MIYLVIFFISCACLFISPLYWPQYTVSLVFLIMGIGVLSTQIKVELKNLSTRTYLLLLLIPLIVIFFIVPFPFNTGFLLLCIGILLIVLFPSKTHLSRFSFSLLFIGIVFVAISIINPLINTILSRFHDFSLINFFVDPLLKLLNLNSAWEGGNLYIQSLPGVEWILTTTEKTGLYFSLVFFIGSSIFILLYRQQKRIITLIKLFVIQSVYIILRYVFVVSIFLNSGKASIFWDRWIEILTFIPLIVILLKLVPLKISGKVISISFEKFTFSKKYIPVIIYTSLFVFVITALFLFHDPGKLKNGRVLLDEKHSDWEWTEEKLDTAWFGKKSLYNYYCLADYISHYYHFERNFELITDDILEKCDILIIKTPTSTYSENEIEAIERFVDNGGGLLLIGDHTNVFGTSTFINPVAQRFGIQFNYDATYEFKTGSLSVYKPPEFYSHPVVQSMPTFLFGTSCTLDVPLFAENVIMGYGLKAVYLDYSKKNFFSTQNESSFLKYGLFMQCAGIKHGKGRVLAFSDSTVFSNFWIFMPGKPELFSGFLNWLNRMNTFFSFKLLLFFVCLFFFWMMKNQSKKLDWFQSIYVLSITGGIIFLLFYFLFSTLKFSSYTLPDPHTEYYRISIDNEYSDISMPILALTEDYTKSYNTFFIALQRLGYFPNISGSLDESIDENDLVIIINTQKDFPTGLINKISSFLKGGGKLLLLEDGSDSHSPSHELLDKLSIEDIGKSANNNLSLPEASFDDPDTENAIGESFKLDHAESVIAPPYLSAYRSGAGELFIMYNSSLCNDINMGIANAVPNKEQLKNYRLVYDMIEYIVGKD